MKEKYGCTTNYYLESFPKKAKEAIRSVQLLGDYQLHGVVIRRIKKRKGYVKPPQFEEALTAYEKECESNEYSLRGMRTRLQRLFFFIDYLSLRKVMNISEITLEIISDYVISVCPNHEKSIASILTTLTEAQPVKDIADYDQVWRHLNFAEYPIYFHAEHPRTICGKCNSILRVNVPWAIKPRAGFTTLFDAWIIAMAKDMPMNAGSRIVKETDKRLWRILHHYVDNAIAVQDLSHVTKISTDENEVKTISPSL